MARKRSAKKRKIITGPIKPIELGSFAQDAMHAYGSYVLMDRAVADVRDGLKPVQRRILWAMHELKLTKGYKKSAKVVGDTMGNFHPHGDSSIYQTMVNMVGDRYPLIEGHGNFGGPTDNAAAARYTEARLSPLAEALFADISVAEMVPNYSDDRKEPLVIPSRLPLLLLNGSSGIGVGLRASVPPHNLRELVRCLVYFIKKDNPRLSSVVKNMPGPDYGHGILLSSPQEVHDLYLTGKGTLRFRCEYLYEEGPTLVVTSLAPGFNMGVFLRKMRTLSEEGLIDYCSDSSSADGVRIYVGFKDASVLRKRVLPELHTTQSYQFYVVKRDGSSTLSSDTLFSGGLFRMFEEFVSFRRQVEEARLRRDLLLSKAVLFKAKAILAAIENIDAVYTVLRYDSAKDLGEMTSSLASKLNLTEKQASWILDMKVHRLARMNTSSQEDKISDTLSNIAELKGDLENIDGVIVRHLKELMRFSDDRGTLFGSDMPEPVLDVEPTLTWVMSQGTKLTRLSGVPSKRNKFDLVTSGSEFVTAVYDNNNAESLATSYLTGHSGDRSVVGLISGEDSLLVALDTTGLVVVLKHPPGKKSSFNVMRDATSLVSAVGLPGDGRLVAAFADGKGVLVNASDLKGTRAFVRGFKLAPTRSNVLTQLLALPSGADLYNSKGRCLSLGAKERFDAKGPVIAIGTRNFVAVKGGKRDILSKGAALKLLKRGELDTCWILS